MSTQQRTTVVPEGIRARLTFFKVMAIIVGIGLLLLVLGMILRYGFGHPTLSKTWSPIHGFLYIVYLISTALLGVKAGWTVTKMVGVMLAGTVPFLSFWMEQRVAKSFEEPAPPAG
jgi:integral membrane protein